MTLIFAKCPECARKVQTRDDKFPRHEGWGGGKCAASGTDATAQINVWMMQEMHRLRGRIERRASWWQRDVQPLAALEAIAVKRDCRWTLATQINGHFRVVCTGTLDEIAGVRSEMCRALSGGAGIPNGRSFAHYDPAGALRRRIPANPLDDSGAPVTWPATLAGLLALAAAVTR